jgi:plasmid stability protein
MVPIQANESGHVPEADLPTTITLKNVPDALYARLKQTAELNHRSINSEVIVCLQQTLFPLERSATEILARARSIRDALEPAEFDHDEIDAMKRSGRP